jgi:cyclopropane fatty-acyl-phospholipid synthase-like methyltransferase
MLEYTYQNAPRSTGIGYYIDRTFLNQTLAVAVRGRLETLGNLLRTELNRRSQPKLLNVACGSCRELFDVAPAFVNSGASAICIDFDHQALTYAANKLAYSSINPDKMKFQRYNAIKMINHDRNVKEFGYQDIIYSTGFFDYVSDDVLVRLLKAAMSLLNPDGKLIASFKDCRQYKTQEYHWLVNWDAFFQRTEEDMDRLLEKAEISRSNIQTVREHSGVIKFYIVTK